jgi:acetyl/propionyl-CoA carboxylase alpha subunit
MPAGPGVRVDSGVGAGDRVPPEYDNLVAKLMVHAADRAAAIDRLRRAIDETEIGGIQTTLPFHRFVAGSPAFRDADLSTGWVADHWDGAADHRRAAWIAMAAGGGAAHPGAADGGQAVSASPGSEALPAGSTDGRWRSTGRLDATDRWPR